MIQTTNDTSALFKHQPANRGMWVQKFKVSKSKSSSCGFLQGASRYFYTIPDSHDVSFEMLRW